MRGLSPQGTVPRPPATVPQPKGIVPLRKNQGGYLLVTIIVSLFFLATIAVLLNRESAISANTSNAELDGARAEYVAQAALQHAMWRAGNNACMGDVTIPISSLGADSYTATISGAAAGTLYTVTADQDAWIRSDDATKNNGTTADQHLRFETGNVEQALTRFDLSSLPANAKINSASAWFHIKSGIGNAHPEGPLTVHRVTADWTETGATWETMSGKYDSSTVATISAQSNGGIWVSFNLTGQVQAWANGQPNYGILMTSAAEGVHGQYVSREGTAGEQPYIEIVVGSGPASPVSIQATGTLADGVTRTLSRPLAAAYQPPVVQTFNPGPAESNDAEIWDQSPNNNYGDAVETWVSSDGNDTTRSLLRFNMGAIPAGASILDATLFLHRQSGSGADQPVSAHRIMNPWSEDSVTWNSRESGTNWDSAGGDFDGVGVVTTPVGPANQRYEWNITPLAQAWVDGSYPNYGVAMVAAIDGMAGERFYTSDQADTALRPGLTITYACECGNACMAPQGTGRIALIGDNVATPDVRDLQRKHIFESWGYTVDIFMDSQIGSIDTNVYDVVYVSETASGSGIGTQLTGFSIGVVNEEPKIFDDLGASTSHSELVGSTIDITDNSHYITAPFAVGALPIYAADMEILTLASPLAPGLQTFAEFGGSGSLSVLDTGAQLVSGGNASARRVLLPLGEQMDSNFDWGFLNNNGRLIVQRAIAWAAKADFVVTANLLMVVGNDSSLTSQEEAKQTLLESWGYAVNVIDEDDIQGEFDTALATNDVVFVTEDVNDGDLSNKLVNATIGVVTEEVDQADNLGFDTAPDWNSGTSINIVDNSHYITQPFSIGNLTVLNTSESLAFTDGTSAPDIIILGTVVDEPAVAALEAGASIIGGGMAAGRRVLLPWGGDNMDVAHLNTDGLTVFQRALEWGAGATIPETPTIVLATADNATVGGLTFTDKDLAHYAPATDTGTLYLDGPAAGLTEDIDAIHILANDHIVMSTIGSGSLGGQAFDNEDLINYNPASNSATLLFDGSELFTNGSTDISAVYVMDNGHLLLTNEYSATLGGLAFNPEDIIDYDPVADSAVMFLDGSTVGLSGWINAVYLLETGNIVLSTETNATLGGLGIAPDDLIEYDPISDSATLNFDGSLFSSSEDVRAVHIGPGIGIDAGTLPIAHWALDETSGTTAVDSVGGHNGTLVNMDPSTDWVTGMIDGALELDGSNDNVRVAHDNNLWLTDEMTFTAWANTLDNSGNYQAIVAKDTPGNGASNYWFGINNDELVFGFWASGSFRKVETTGANLGSDTWYHLAASFDNASDEVRLYVDGTQTQVGSIGHEPTTETAELWIGKSPDGEHWYGLLDDVRLYDKALSSGDVADLASVGGGGGGDFCADTYRDEFNDQSYAGSDGTLKWSTDWLEINESDGPTSGDERVDDNDSDFHLQVRDNDGGGEGVQREADLAGYTSATLSFEYRRDGFDNDNDYVIIQMSDDGGSSWNDLESIGGSGTDKSYVPKSYDISKFIASNTRIRFLTSSNLGSGDEMYIDNVQIEVSGCAGP